VIRITKLHLIIIVLALAMAGVYVNQVQLEKKKKAQLPIAEVSKESFKTQYEEERRRQLELENKERLAIEVVANAGGYWDAASKMGRDVALGEETLRSAKGFLVQKQFDKAYELAVRSIEEFKAAKLKEEAAPAKTEEVKPKAVRSKNVYYSVRRGDCLWNIAKMRKHYGDGNKWRFIWKANIKKVPKRNLIYPKQVLLIPRIQIRGVMRPK